MALYTLAIQQNTTSEENEAPERNSYQRNRRFKQDVSGWTLDPSSLSKLRKRSKYKLHCITDKDLTTYPQAVIASTIWTEDMWMSYVPALWTTQMESCTHVVGAALKKTIRRLGLQKENLSELQKKLHAMFYTLVAKA